MTQTENGDSGEGIECPLYDPFRRKDRFGVIGTAAMGLSDRLIVTLFSVVVLPVRAVLSLGLLVACYIFCSIVQLLPLAAQPALMGYVGPVFCHLCALAIGLHIQWIDQSGGSSSASTFPCAVVSNHVSWLDILVHMAHNFPSFVAATSVRDIPFVGKISEMMECVFVQRENRSEGYQGISGKVRDRMIQTSQSRSQHRKMLLFPEGTTTNGNYLLKFKTGAFLAGLPVQPVVLIYSSRWISPAWETITGRRHVRLMFSFPYATVKFVKLPVYSPSAEEKEDPELFAANVRDFMIAASTHPFEKSDATIVHKRRYQELLQASLLGSTDKKD